MVATSGAGWRLAPSLKALVAETDRLYPNRDHTSDGSIGDASHQARGSASDHNPADGWVCAVDLDEDLSSTLHTIEALADHLIAERDHRVKYLIYEGRICKSYLDSRGIAPWTWQPYTGLNDHTHHLHVSVWNTTDARGDTGPWWPQEDDDMKDDERLWLKQVHDTLVSPDPAHPAAMKVVLDGARRIDDIEAKVNAIAKKLGITV